MSQNSLVQQSKPVLFEGIIVILIGLVVIYNLTATDISFHGNYVGKLIEICHPNNQDKTCMEFREHLKVEPDAQMELGNAYWNELARQAFFVGVVMSLIRFGFAYILHKSHVQKIRPSSIMMVLLYGTVGYVLFVSGVLDTLYFVLQNQPIPQELGWLDFAGLFQWTKSWTGNAQIVDKNDLLLTNLLGIAIIGIVLFVTMVLFKDSGMKKAIA